MSLVQKEDIDVKAKASWALSYLAANQIQVCLLLLILSPLVNSRRACAAKVTVVGLSVCVSTLILALQATKRPISDTSGFRTTGA